MVQVSFKGQKIELTGKLIEVGDLAPDFHLTKPDLTGFYLRDVKGKNIVLNIFPSLDLSVSANTVRKFNEIAVQIPNTVILSISKDLPFAHARFFNKEGFTNVIGLSDFRYSDFGVNYGVLMESGPFYGLLARAIVVINPQGRVIHTELVDELGLEPNYESVLKVLKEGTEEELVPERVEEYL